jgi:hypothetical protein
LTKISRDKPAIGAQLFCCFFRHLSIAFDSL